MKMLVRFALVLLLAVSAAPMAAPNLIPNFLPASVTPTVEMPDRELPKANYDLASRWTSAKVGKYVFSTAVTPHWLEFSDRFWYDYETPAGRKWWVVDPLKKSKTPLFDNAKMAAQLTRILRTPYDAQHLPLGTIRFYDNDTKIRFSVTLPRDARVENAAGEEITGMTQTQDQGRGGGGGAGRGGGGGGRGGQQQQQGGRAGAPGAPAPVGNATWWLEYDFATQTVVLNDKYKPETTGNPTWATVSPDKKFVVYSRNRNLFMMDAENFEKAKKAAGDPTIVEHQLTTDGVVNYAFGGGGRGGGGNQDQQQQDDNQTDQEQGGGRGGGAQQSEADKKYGGARTSAGGVTWSQDNKFFSVSRSDSRKVADLWVINSLANPRPTLNTYKYGMPGEAEQPQPELHVVDLEAKKALKVKTEAFKDQNLSLVTAPSTNLQREKQEVVSRWISTAGDKVYYSRTSRDLKRIDIVEADTKTGESRVVIPERSNTYIEVQPLRLINSGKQAIHWSERDGWGHYYLYDISGKLLRQVTSGEFVATGITAVDEKTRMLYFTGVGKETNEDPYFQHFYSVNLDTGAMKLLDPGNASHTVAMNDKCTYFVDNSSRIDSAPESVLYDSAGNKVMDLEKTDVSSLLEAGFRYPEAFAVKADDGITDIYGTMYKPFDFDPSKKYPIIAYVYPGPQTESVTKTFSPRNASVALANVGFIVIEVGNRGGNPQRSKWYHNYGYGNLRDYGVPDKKAAIEQLAKRHAWIDLDRVGMWGHSGGGFMTAAAMFGYPDFFKVGISESGNHDNSIYNRSWSEKHDGVKEIVGDDGKVTFQYDIDKNQDIAANLKGRLLLITGDVDNNVHPANTYRVADALIRANKRFDFILLPGQAHGYTTMGDYVFWRRIDYFAEHLLGSKPSGIDIVELERERQIPPVGLSELEETPQQRRKQDDPGAARPLHERVILALLGLVGLGAAMMGVWWLWDQSGASAVVRDGSPNWHPDSQHVIFASEQGGKADLYVTDLSGGNRHPVGQQDMKPADEGGAAYSPDGKWIAFHSDRDGDFEIYVMNAEGEAVRPLTDDPGIDQAPAWSPDGKQLVFMSNRANPGFDIMRMNADGSGVERLTTTGTNGYPQYSPDGMQLALHVARDVHVMSLSTRGLRRLTYESHDGNGMYPTWSPDGARLAFMSWRNGRSEIFTTRADSTEQQAVVTMPTGDAVDPRWSPDGRFIAFVHLPAAGITAAQQPVSQRIVYTVEVGTSRLTRISR